MLFMGCMIKYYSKWILLTGRGHLPSTSHLNSTIAIVQCCFMAENVSLCWSLDQESPINNLLIDSYACIWLPLKGQNVHMRTSLHHYMLFFLVSYLLKFFMKVLYQTCSCRKGHCRERWSYQFSLFSPSSHIEFMVISLRENITKWHASLLSSSLFIIIKKTSL